MGAYGKTEVYGAEEQSFVPENYHHFTFDTAKQRTYFGEEETLSIDSVIHYVKSLNLEAVGFKHVEEACLAELESYKANGTELESYTVLFPKTRAMNYYGTYGADKFYYDTTSIVVAPRLCETITYETYNENNWLQWVRGGLNIVISYFDSNFTLPFTILNELSNIVVDGNSIIPGVGLKFYVRFPNATTKTIYKQMSTGFAPGFQYQESDYLVEMYYFKNGESSPGIEFLGVIIDDFKSTAIADKNTVMREALRAIYQGSIVILSIDFELGAVSEWKLC